ncbi:MAG: YbaK/EbsC family protein [Myxococcales bacterium]|nr:MAG: YbaK/EbsC family protein [Myxococcales bacterium]
MSDTTPEHPRIAAFRGDLERHQAEPRIVVLPESVHTAQLAADALGCEVGAIANSLLFAAIGLEHPEPTPLLLLTSGAHRVDTDMVAAELGLDRLTRASADFVTAHSGQVIGGVSPLGHPEKIPTYLDPTLRKYDEIWAAAGHPAAVFATTYDELRAMTAAVEQPMNRAGQSS